MLVFGHSPCPQEESKVLGLLCHLVLKVIQPRCSVHHRYGSLTWGRRREGGERGREGKKEGEGKGGKEERKGGEKEKVDRKGGEGGKEERKGRERRREEGRGKEGGRKRGVRGKEEREGREGRREEGKGQDERRGEWEGRERGTVTLYHPFVLPGWTHLALLT